MTTDRQPLARRLLRLYPRSWRARYETEVLALIQDTGLTTPHVLDLVRGAGREWIRLPHRQMKQLVLDGVFLPFEKRISVGYERYFWGAILARAVVGLLVYAAAGPVGRWLLRVDQNPAVDWALWLTPLIAAAGVWRVMRSARGTRRHTADEDAAFATDLDRYPLPAVNRWLSWALRRLSRARTTGPLLSMSILEAVIWTAASVIGVSVLDANRDTWTLPLYSQLSSLYWSFYAGLLITSSFAAVIRRYAGNRPATD